MSYPGHTSEEITPWAHSLKVLRFCEAFSTGSMRDESERLLAAIKIDSEQDFDRET
jgi:hypothetical protein